MKEVCFLCRQWAWSNRWPEDYIPSKCYMDLLILTFCVKLCISIVRNDPQNILVEKKGLLLFKYFSPYNIPVCLSIWPRSFPRAATRRVWVPTTFPFSSRWAGNFRKKLTALVGPSRISHSRFPWARRKSWFSMTTANFHRFRMLSSEKASWCFGSQC